VVKGCGNCGNYGTTPDTEVIIQLVKLVIHIDTDTYHGSDVAQLISSDTFVIRRYRVERARSSGVLAKKTDSTSLKLTFVTLFAPLYTVIPVSDYESCALLCSSITTIAKPYTL